MTRHLIPFIATCLLLTYNPTQGQVLNGCDLIASGLANNLTYPRFLHENQREAKLIVWYFADSKADTFQIHFLKKAKYETVNKMVDKYLRTQVVTPSCDCIFNIDFDILYLDSTHTLLDDTLLITTDSLTRLLSAHHNITYQTKIGFGQQLSSDLDSLYSYYISNDKALPNIKEETEATLPKKFGFKSLKLSKDSILIRITKIDLLLNRFIGIYKVGLDNKGDWYAEKLEMDKWESINVNEEEIAHKIVPSLIKLPSRPKYPIQILDGVSYCVEVWTHKKYRTYSLSNPEPIARDYGFWIDKEFVTIMDKLTSR